MVVKRSQPERLEANRGNEARFRAAMLTWVLLACEQYDVVHKNWEPKKTSDRTASLVVLLVWFRIIEQAILGLDSLTWNQTELEGSLVLYVEKLE